MVEVKGYCGSLDAKCSKQDLVNFENIPVKPQRSFDRAFKMNSKALN